MRCKKLVLACGLGLATVANAGVMVGYLDLSASPTPNIQTSVEHGYNVVVVGWGVVNTDDTASIYPVTLSNDGGHDGLQADIARAHDAQAKVLLTFGGMNNTFNPVANGSVGDAQAIALNIEKLLNDYKFDGVDFDLENSNTTYSTSFITDIIAQLRKDIPNIIISGAPQILAWEYMNPWQPGTIGFAHVAGTTASWNDLAKSGAFDYIWVQDYNQGPGGVIFINGSTAQTQDTNSGFLAASYDTLLTSSDSQVSPLPANTRLILGVPSTPSAGQGISDTGDIKAELNCLQLGSACTFTGSTFTGELKPSKAYTLPGLMTWSIGDDANHNPNGAWAFVNGVQACVVSGQCS